MPTTLVHNISYPSGSAAPNVPLAMQTTAESVEAALVGLKPVAAVLTAGSVQSIPAAAWTKLVYDATELNNGTTISLGVGTITVSEGGLYLITVTGGTSGTNTGSFGVRIDVNGVTQSTTLAAASSAGSSAVATALVSMSASAVVSSYLFQSSGASRTVTTARLGVTQISGL